jgi:cyclopropane-fatty-acyl-phospholipid synthase
MVATGKDIETTLRFLNELFGPTALRDVSVRLWDGELWPDAAPRAATLVLKHPGALREMLGPGTEMGLAEAFLRDDFDIEGKIEAAFELPEALAQRRAGWLAGLRDFYRLHQLPTRGGPTRGRSFADDRGGRHSLSRDRRAVSFHYDLSNEFYQLWLDRRMVYSCAYFEQPGMDLEAAQAAKLRYLCRKLRLRPGQRLLDIGCGWGGLALYAAENFGVKVTGITLSERQAELATDRARAAGLADAVSIQRVDYRELPHAEPFDAIVSVGMSEHVGASHLADYFKVAAAQLKPGGAFLNHAIGEGIRRRERAGPSFIDEYVFPDSDIPPIPLVVQAAEQAGLEVRDVENLREHYALTLRHWVQRLEQAHASALAWVDESTFRIWRLYMAGSAYGFAHDQLAIYQTLLVKPDESGNSHLPLTRRDWYEGPPSPPLIPVGPQANTAPPLAASAPWTRSSGAG